MKTLDEFKALTVEQIAELDYDKVSECKDRLREILVQKSNEINKRGYDMFFRLIGDICPNMKVSVVPSAYRVIIIKIPETKYEIAVTLFNIKSSSPEITVTVYPELYEISLTEPDENKNKLIMMLNTIVMSYGIKEEIISIIREGRAEIEEIKDIYELFNDQHRKLK